MHWPIVAPNDKLEFQHKPVHIVWKEMEDLVNKGLVKSLGVSNFNVMSLVDLLTYANVKPVINQVELHVYL